MQQLMLRFDSTLCTNLGDSSSLKRIQDDIERELAKSAIDHIKAHLTRSVQLQSFIGLTSDPEAIRTVLNNITVRFERGKLATSFNPNLYGLMVPNDIVRTIQQIIDEALGTWVASPDIMKLIAGELSKL